MHTFVSIPGAHENPPAEGLLGAERRTGCPCLSEPALCWGRKTRGDRWTLHVTRGVCVSHQGAPPRGDTELTEAPRGGKPGGNLENKQAGPRPRGRKTPSASGTFPQPTWLAGVSGGRVGGRGHSALSASGLEPECEAASSCRKGCVNRASPQRTGGVPQTLLE